MNTLVAVAAAAVAVVVVHRMVAMVAYIAVD